MNDDTPQTDTQVRARPGHRWLPRLLWSLGAAVALFVATMAALQWSVGRDFVAPAWLRDEAQARLNRNSGNLSVSVGEIVARVEQGWRPRVILRDVDVARPDGQLLVSLANVDAGLAMAPLLRGKVQPARIRLSGASLRLRRLSDGSFDLAFGDTLAPVGQGATLGQLMKGLDDLLSRPETAALRRIEAEALTLRYEDMRLNRGWTVDGGRLRLERLGDTLDLSADFALLGGGDTVTTLELNYDSVIGATAARFGVNVSDMSAQDIAVHSPALAWLDVLRAPISGAMRVAVDDQGMLGPLSAALQIGAGVLQPTDETRPIPFESLRAYMTYVPHEQRLVFDDLTLVSKWATTRAEGVALMKGIENGWPNEFVTQLTVTEISANPADLYPGAVVLEGADVDLRLRLDPFDLQVGRMTIRDQGQVAQLSGRLQATPDGWVLGVRGAMDAVSPERVLALWPESAAPRARGWIGMNLETARLRDIELAYRAVPREGPDLYLGFGFDAAAFRYLREFPQIAEASGRASLRDSRFVVTADSGRVIAPQGGRVDIGGTTFVVPDVRIREAPAQVMLRAKSTITAALSLLDLDPFNFLTKAGQPVTLADGRAEIEAAIDIRLKKKLPPEEVKVDARARLLDARSDKVVPGRVIAARALDVTVADDRLRIEGAGRIGKVLFDAAWESPLGKGAMGSRVSGEVELSQLFAEEFNIGLPPGSLSGQARANIAIELPGDGQPAFSLRSDMAGLGLSLPQIGWSLPQDRTGTLEVAGLLGTPPRIDRLLLDAPGLRATGTVRLTDGGELAEARFDRVQAGDWLDAQVTLSGRGAGAAPAVSVTGGTVDLRRTAIGGGGGSGGAGGGPITLALDRLQISEGIALTGFRGEFGTARGMDGSFAARVNGAAPITGRVAPRDGRSAFRILSDDAGAVFAAAGLLKRGHQGRLDLTLLPAGQRGSYDGFLTVDDVRLREAPALAELLNAVSVVGLLEQLSGTGILFNEVEAEFRLTPERVIVTSSSATGASLGISMDGTYDMGDDRMDMQGVFSPLYLLNSIGSVLTRKGEGLIGFNYRLTGTAEAPRVQVNPLSILTPGMFREIFRRPAPEVTQ